MSHKLLTPAYLEQDTSESALVLQKTWNPMETNELLPRAILRADVPPCHTVPPHSNEIVKSTLGQQFKWQKLAPALVILFQIQVLKSK